MSDTEGFTQDVLFGAVTKPVGQGWRDAETVTFAEVEDVKVCKRVETWLALREIVTDDVCVFAKDPVLEGVGNINCDTLLAGEAVEVPVDRCVTVPDTDPDIDADWVALSN